MKKKISTEPYASVRLNEMHCATYMHSRLYLVRIANHENNTTMINLFLLAQTSPLFQENRAALIRCMRSILIFGVGFHINIHYTYYTPACAHFLPFSTQTTTWPNPTSSILTIVSYRFFLYTVNANILCTYYVHWHTLTCTFHLFMASFRRG